MVKWLAKFNRCPTCGRKLETEWSRTCATSVSGLLERKKVCKHERKYWLAYYTMTDEFIHIREATEWR